MVLADPFRALAVALGGQNYSGSRTPFLLACAEATHGITPTVEVNIPQGSDAPDRSVNGCVCVDERGRFILVHRGSSFTVTPWKVPKKAVHRHFSKWLQVVEDGDRQASVIPIGPIGRGLVEQMALFAQMVLQLKRDWATNQGQAPAVSRVSGWRDDLNFPGKIRRAFSSSQQTYEYRHGPIQSDLQRALAKHLPRGWRVVLNQNVDLGILDPNSTLIAIFEVKTGLGDQLYGAIGQLLCYRHQFGTRATRLFLVAPPEAFRPQEAKAVGNLLRDLGITLLVHGDGYMKSWQGDGMAEIAAPPAG